MKITFKQRLDQELLFSEKRRVIILIAIFSAAMVLRLVNQFYIKPDEETLKIESFSTIWLFPLVIVLFESCSLIYINSRIKAKQKGIPLYLQYINAIIEICLPSLIILYVAKEYRFYNVLQSPAVFIYFIFIILSTLRLNFTLSFFCGLLAALSYVSFSFFLYDHFNTNDAARAFILLFSGIAAGLVARQIKQGINNSLHEAERRHRAENLFGQQISMEIAEKMLENDGKLESKRMNVAVMFIDIRNFTHFVAGKTPEEIVQYQNAFFTIVVNCVTKYNGIINQFLGDGCMVTFGAPVPIDNPGAIAVDAALEILREIDRAMKNYALQDTRVGIGIHTGDAVTGNIGTEYRQQYSITGNVVIVASRIEQLNKQYDSQVLVSEDIVKTIKNRSVPTELVGTVVLKGMHDLFPVYKVA
jgi:adenylate cyclase